MLRDLLVHVTGTTSAQARLDYALAIGRASSARVTGIHVLAPFEVPPVVRVSQIAGAQSALMDQAERLAAAAEAQFRRQTVRGDVETRWLGLSGHTTDQLCKAARYADLVIVGHESLEAAPERNPLSVADELVLNSGRPVLIVPDQAAPSPPKRILVAWDGSRQAVRAVHDALPLLRTAEAGVIVTAPSSHERLDDDVLKGDALADHLGRHGVRNLSVEASRIAGSDTRAILERLRRGHFDLLVMGAFRRWPLIELVLGGTTEDVVQSSRTPVFMSH